jgi:putative transposase
LASKKVRAVAVGERREWIDAGHSELSVSRQCRLTGLSRSGLYYEPRGESAVNLKLMGLLDEQYTKTPFFGVPKMTEALRKRGYRVNPKRVRRLLRQMGLEAIYPKPHLSAPAPGHRIYPYRLRDAVITRPNQVWSSDITYIRLRAGFIYLVAVIDWFSRYVLSWEVSTSLDAGFCCSALDRALRHGRPEIFNTDQGAQFTSEAFTGRLEAENIVISMDGRGRALDNVFVERLWRTVKYEDVYLKDYSDPPDAVRNLGPYFKFYNAQRPHQALKYLTPEAVYFGVKGQKTVMPKVGLAADRRS